MNPRKAAGPDGIPGAVIKACADQLAGILTKIFNLSLAHATVPKCLKATIIVPIPKKPAIDSLNDYRPIALTSVVCNHEVLGAISFPAHQRLSPSLP